MKVLLADDDTIFRTLMVHILFDGGYETIEAENGVVAWQYLQSERVDIAVIDINMPEMDGNELIRLIRSDEKLKSLPILVLTIGFIAEDIVQQYDPLITDYITKPFETDALLKKVREIERRMIQK